MGLEPVYPVDRSASHCLAGTKIAAPRTDEPVKGAVYSRINRDFHGFWPNSREQRPSRLALRSADFERFAYTARVMSDLEPTTERRTVKGKPLVVLIALIGSCYAIGYAIYRLLKGMKL